MLCVPLHHRAEALFHIHIFKFQLQALKPPFRRGRLKTTGLMPRAVCPQLFHDRRLLIGQRFRGQFPHFLMGLPIGKVGPDRRVDPGPMFPWKKVLEKTQFIPALLFCRPSIFYRGYLLSSIFLLGCILSTLFFLHIVHNSFSFFQTLLLFCQINFYTIILPCPTAISVPTDL